MRLTLQLLAAPPSSNEAKVCSREAATIGRCPGWQKSSWHGQKGEYKSWPRETDAEDEAKGIESGEETVKMKYGKTLKDLRECLEQKKTGIDSMKKSRRQAFDALWEHSDAVKEEAEKGKDSVRTTETNTQVRESEEMINEHLARLLHTRKKIRNYIDERHTVLMKKRLAEQMREHIKAIEGIANKYEIVMKQIVALIAQQDQEPRDFEDTRKIHPHLVCELDKREEKKNVKIERVPSKVSKTSKVSTNSHRVLGRRQTTRRNKYKRASTKKMDEE